jgi:co-chaperonin GroES (HSP10)
MAKERIVPRGRRLLVEMLPIEETYGDSKIVIADTHREREQLGQSRGIVLAVGDMCWRDLYAEVEGLEFNPWCQVGDKIVFQSFSGLKARKDSKLEMLINDLDVLGVVIEEEDEDDGSD